MPRVRDKRSGQRVLQLQEEGGFIQNWSCLLHLVSMPPRAEGAASRGGKMTARATPGGKTPTARSPRQRSPAAEGKSRTSSDKKQKSKHESGSPAGRNSSGGSGSGGSGHREMGDGGSSGSRRRGMSQDDPTPGQPDASGLHLVISLDFGNGGTGYAYEYKGPEGSVLCFSLSFSAPSTCLLLLGAHLRSEFFRA